MLLLNRTASRGGGELGGTTVPPRLRGRAPAGPAWLPGSVGPKESKKLNVFPLEGSWKIFSVFRVPMAAV